MIIKKKIERQRIETETQENTLKINLIITKGEKRQ
jgi:hypothetical protein